MNISLGNIPISLNTPLTAVENEWSKIFVNHQIAEASPQITLEALPIEQAPKQDPHHSIRMFTTESGSYSLALNPNGDSILTLASEAILVIPDLHLPYIKEDVHYNAKMYITPSHIELGQVEDITFTLLAPILRRKGIFMVHAFGLKHPSQEKALLIIAPSGQGKTTTGLYLTQHGWHYLGNDVILLSADESGSIRAWPSPGKINLHPDSLEFFPSLEPQIHNSHFGQDGKYHLAASELINPAKGPASVSALIFPILINEDGPCRLEKMQMGIALSQTMAQSIDNWDTALFETHFAFLEHLTTQATTTQAFNTPDISSVRELFIAL